MQAEQSRRLVGGLRNTSRLLIVPETMALTILDEGSLAHANMDQGI